MYIRKRYDKGAESPPRKNEYETVSNHPILKTDWALRAHIPRFLQTRPDRKQEFCDKEVMTVRDADGASHEIMVYTMNEPYRDQLLPVSSRYTAVVLQGCHDAGISPQQFYEADEKYRKAYKARTAPAPKKRAPER